MNGRFTQKAERALNLALVTARELGHNYIGSEHILAGLAREGEGFAAAILANNDAGYEKIAEMIIKLEGQGVPSQVTPNDMTPRSKRIIEASLANAAGMGVGYIGTEHLLLAVLREDDSVAAKVLGELGIDAEDLYDETMSALGKATGAIGSEGGMTASGRKSGGKNPAGKTPTLDQFGRDLTELAANGKIDPVIGRDNETERVVQILSRRTKNNPVLIGEPGVGKTAVVEGLATRIVEGNVPDNLKNKRLVTLDLSGMIAGTKYRGEFEERIKGAIDEVIKAGNVMMFIDELHTIVGAGGAEGAVDAANILKPSLARGEFQIIGATTLDEYRKHIEKDAALERRFQPVMVGEPTEEESIAILRGLRDRYEAHHNVKISDEAIDAAVKLSRRYVGDRFLPDKAIDCMDEAASKVRLQKLTAPPELKGLEQRALKLSAEKEEAIGMQDFERAARIRDEENTARREFEEKRAEWEGSSSGVQNVVTEEDIAEVISKMTGIPVVRMTEEESERLLRLEDTLHKRVIGQEEAVTAVSKAIRRGRMGLKDPKRPTGSFIFLGPTGVGKTELSKALAEAVFADEDAVIRVDMSEFMEKHTVSRLVGSPPGYVGYDEGGQLTEKVRRRPYSVILFDEIEKAHPDVFNILLQILEDGILTDAQGRRVDFKNTIIIMTSNVGARAIVDDGRKLGFVATDDSRDPDSAEKRIKNEVMSELKKTFRPEFLNRVDDIIVFSRLSEEDIEKIAAKMAADVGGRAEQAGIILEFEEDAVKHLAKAGFDPVYGARPLRREIQNQVEDKLSELMLEKKIVSGNRVRVTANENELVFTVD